MAPEATPIKSNHPITDPAADSDSYVRLHITPLDQELLKIVLPATVLSAARNISLHTLETFPEKRYGFVDLPQTDAEKLKKKLNGSTLKGTKMRIEKARVEERIEPSGHVDTGADAEKSKKRKSKDELKLLSKKHKRDANLVEGVVLKDRKVKRGWTESTDTKVKNKKSKDKSAKDKDKDQEKKKKKKRLKSKYTEQDECLLKTRLPANKVGNLPPSDAYKKKKKRGNTREVTVHEFEKTSRFPGFLKNAVPEREGKEPVEFVDGKGWVDEDGEVVEAVKMPKVPKATNKKAKKVVAEESDDDSTSSSGTSSEEDSNSESEDAAETAEPKDILAYQQDSGMSVSSSQDDDGNTSSSASDDDETGNQAAGLKEPRPMSSSSSRSLTIKIPPPPTTPAKVHPLEALYKRPKPDETTSTPAPAQTNSFSFFGAADNPEDDDIEREAPVPSMPMTPYTRQDFEWRNIRSAAPTPDTAHPSRIKNFWAPQDDDDEDAHEGSDNEETEAQIVAANGQQGASDFQSWFWENRRDLNKSWMTRRKTVAKEKRHKENKARASKAI
ncbi:hypothetical protein QQS21_010630 [Conoideocrella luteorostrata]|uniref:RRM domain-containing protein n=1 Tax=Conoideocrella luteorostrata TaxID=1105319 RepID=A0AAJ0CEX9_9HYPO|nr:hypothetical protein QQS21_010630 [Conoideocrella luteorostrata]